ncbi:hypothetical protein, partial [Tepidibacter sp. Z1-5]|uniref:hypothetical protein n=1 Tax=Tepidibacter sp. Z1-5 TaxID=3134138 RepID=UPI0030C4DCED
IVVDFDQSGLIANGKSYEVSTKGYSSKTAKNIAKNIDISDYAQADKTARVYEIPNTVRNRIIIVQILSS